MSEEVSDHKELKSGWKDEVSVKSFSQAEIQKHSSKTDMWISIHGKVYDVTSYARDHPGGPEVLREVAGKDATSDYEDVGHSDDAREILHGLLVGVVEGYKEASDESSDPSANVAPVQIVRRKPSGAAESAKSSKIAHGKHIAPIAVGAAGLLWAANRLHLTSYMLSGDNLAVNLSQSSHSRLLLGFLLTTVSAGAIAIAGFKYLEKAMSFNAGFKQFPAHMKSTVTTREPFHPAGVLIPSQYQKFKLRRKEELHDGIYRFVFDLPSKHAMLGLPIGQHVATQANIDGHVVVRSYTPVSNNRDLGRLELLIRVYPKGKMGNYLKNLEVGDTADFRGPKGAMKYRKTLVKSLGMVAGGTGITPMYQIIRSICEDPLDNTQVTLMYANRSEADIMLREKLDHFAKTASKQFKLVYVVDEAPTGWKGEVGHITKELLAEHMPKPSPDSKVLLCGPPGMVNAMKKNLVDLGFENPGAVAKLQDQVFCF